MQNISTHAFRLKPGQDLKAGIHKIVTENQIKAGWISTGVGSLTDYNPDLRISQVEMPIAAILKW